jgi:hypothetical protein
MVGQGLEGLSEYLAGDEALKSLSLAKRLGLAARVAKVAEAHPTIAKIINAGLKVLRGSAVSGSQSAAHGQSPVEGAVYGAGGELAGEALGAGAKFLGTKTPKALEESAKTTFETERAAKSAATRALQTKAQTDIENVALNAARKVTGREPTPNGLGLYSFGDAAADIKKDADPVFNQLRKESNGLFDIAKNQADNARKVLRNPATVDAAEAAQKSLEDAHAKMEQVFAVSKTNPEDLAKARSSWRQASTLEELHDRIDRAFSTPQKAAKSIAQSGGAAPDVLITPGKYKSQLNAAINSIPADRLAETVGDQGVARLYKISDELSNALSSDKNQKALKAAIREAVSKSPHAAPASTLAYGGGIGYLAHLVGLSGPAVSVPAAAIHWMYTHPVQGEIILRRASQLAPTTAQATKQLDRDVSEEGISGGSSTLLGKTRRSL